jgi:ABC-type glycerol-3-phosphate transport system substrate-binding protein
MKRVLILVMTFVMFLSILPKEGYAEKKYDDVIDINLFCMFSYLIPEEGNTVQQYIRDEFGINFIVDGIDIGEQSNKINMWLASGDAPGDVVRMATSYDNIWKLGRAGYIIQTDPLFEEYPDMSAAWDEDIANILWRDPENGKMYCIPGCGFNAETMVVSDLGPIIRQDFMDAAGVERPTTLDELTEVLRAFKNLGQFNGMDIVPLGNSNYSFALEYMFGLNVDFENKTFYRINRNAYGEQWKYMNMLYREGLLDPEYFLLTNEQKQSKLMSGVVGFTIGYWYLDDLVNNAIAAIDPNGKFVGTQWITGPNGFLPTRQDARNGWHHHQVALSSEFAKNEEGMKRFLEFLNWNYGEEGSFVTKYGPAGVYYELGDDSIFRPNEKTLELQAMPDNAWRIQSGIWAYDIANMKEMDYKVLQFSETVADSVYHYWWQNYNWERYDLVKWTLAQTEYRNQNGLSPDEHGSTYPYLYSVDLAERYNQSMAEAVMASSAEECERIIEEYDAYVKDCGILEQTASYFDIYEAFLAKGND